VGWVRLMYLKVSMQQLQSLMQLCRQ